MTAGGPSCGDNVGLAARFRERYFVNRKGGIEARLARWRVMPWLILQRAGLRHWVRAELFFDRSMWVLTGETISRGLLAFGYAESAVTALMIQVLKPGMRFVDVGAHLGYEAILACVIVTPSGRVVSFEPQPSIARYTASNLRHFPHARLVEAAVADSTGELDFHQLSLTDSAFSGVDTPGAGGRIVRVPATRLDDALLDDERPVDFLKVDVEGHELAVLRGATGVLRSDRPVVVLEGEMPSGPESRPRVCAFEEFLSPLGYRRMAFEFDGELRLARPGAFVEGHPNVAFVPEDRRDFGFLLQT